MPIKDKAVNRAYQRQWMRDKHALESPEERAARLERRREYAKTASYIKKRREYDKRHRDKRNKKKRDEKIKKNYGEYAEAKRMLITLMKLVGK